MQKCMQGYPELFGEKTTEEKEEEIVKDGAAAVEAEEAETVRALKDEAKAEAEATVKGKDTSIEAPSEKAAEVK